MYSSCNPVEDKYYDYWTLGMESRDILMSQVIATTNVHKAAPTYGRLGNSYIDSNNEGAWSPKTAITTEWFQVKN